ncbi:hypothetical protein NDU88_000829 [Pleurodeles waltl]|uniref:Uncharacterized protein n=1 Tax=Pleurodeles waltl TaxID=8319 RepID=A0AAV7WK51_PLEWA|nr:hypothetical protein NDU88_000829 [Pleurodeles waltl]
MAVASPGPCKCFSVWFSTSYSRFVYRRILRSPILGSRRYLPLPATRTLGGLSARTPSEVFWLDGFGVSFGTGTHDRPHRCLHCAQVTGTGYRPSVGLYRGIYCGIWGRNGTGSVPSAFFSTRLGRPGPDGGSKKLPRRAPELFDLRCGVESKYADRERNNTDENLPKLANFPLRNSERQEHVRTRWRKKNNRRWSRRPCAMETKGGVTRSRDSKDFFEEKQLVTLRPNTRWRAIAEHAYLQRQMPSNI